MNDFLRDLLNNLSAPTQYWNWIIFGTAILAAMILRFLVWLIVRRRIQGYNAFISLTKHLGKAISWFLPLFFINFALPVMRMSWVVREQLDKALQVGLIITLAWLLTGCVNVVEDYLMSKYGHGKRNSLRGRKIKTQFLFIRRFLISVIIFLAIAAIFLIFKKLRSIGAGLITGVGISGIIIGLAAQKSLSSVLAGLQIAFTQPIRLDDVVVMEGEWGKIEEITLTYVVLLLWDDRRMVIPINYFLEKSFYNWSRTGSQIKGAVHIYADYKVDVDAIRLALHNQLERNNKWDGRLCEVQVTDATEKSVELRFKISAKNADDLFDLRVYVREEMIKFLVANYPESLPIVRSFTVAGAAIASETE